MLSSLLGGISSTALDMYQADKQNKYNKQAQLRSQNFEKYMAEHAHQMEVEDLKNAGLNPVLSSGGNGASHSAASGSSPTSGNFSSGVNSAIEALKFKNEQKNIDANTKTQEAQQQKLASETNQINLENKWIDPAKRAEIKKMNTETAVNSAETALKNSEQEKVYSDIRLNNAKMAEALSNIAYNKRKASGKGFDIGGNFNIGKKGINIGGNLRADW